MDQYSYDHIQVLSSGHVHFHPSSFVGKISLSSVFGDAYAESLYTLDLLNKPYRKVSKDTGMLGSANLMPYTVIKDIYQNKTRNKNTHLIKFLTSPGFMMSYLNFRPLKFRAFWHLVHSSRVHNLIKK